MAITTLTLTQNNLGEIAEKIHNGDIFLHGLTIHADDDSITFEFTQSWLSAQPVCNLYINGENKPLVYWESRSEILYLASANMDSPTFADLANAVACFELDDETDDVA